jgi:peptide/nickel transport system permease protein
MGNSIINDRPVFDEIMRRFPTSLELAIVAMGIGMVFGILSGLISGRNMDKAPDHIIRIGVIMAYSIPIFWLGLMMQLTFGVWLKLFPVSGSLDLTLRLTRITGLNIVDSILSLNLPALRSSISHLVMPSIVLGIFESAAISRITRAQIIEVKKEDYILTAKAKGLKERAIMFNYEFRNALLPVITITGLQFASLLGGAVLTEQVFTISGMGRMLIDSVMLRDFTMVQGIIVWYAIIVSLVTFTIDVLYRIVDPRVKY